MRDGKPDRVEIEEKYMVPKELPEGKKITV